MGSTARGRDGRCNTTSWLRPMALMMRATALVQTTALMMRAEALMMGTVAPAQTTALMMISAMALTMRMSASSRELSEAEDSEAPMASVNLMMKTAHGRDGRGSTDAGMALMMRALAPTTALMRRTSNRVMALMKSVIFEFLQVRLCERLI